MFKCLKYSYSIFIGPIRQLVLVPQIGFLSCSNDGSLRLRNLDGTMLIKMEHPLNEEGKPGFVLGITRLSTGEFVSASEDCTARVWSPEGKLLQVIVHPSGLWCVSALENGEFATGCDDKMVRIFSKNTTRISQEAVVLFEKSVQDAASVRYEMSDYYILVYSG